MKAEILSSSVPIDGYLLTHLQPGKNPKETCRNPGPIGRCTVS